MLHDGLCVNQVMWCNEGMQMGKHIAPWESCLSPAALQSSITITSAAVADPFARPARLADLPRRRRARADSSDDDDADPASASTSRFRLTPPWRCCEAVTPAARDAPRSSSESSMVITSAASVRRARCCVSAEPTRVFDAAGARSLPLDWPDAVGAAACGGGGGRA